MSLIFISYASEDRTRVKELYDRLRSAGHDPWMDSADIIGGEDWERSIGRAIHSADFFVACLSNNSVQKRGFLQKEFLQALDKWREKLPDDIYLIPVKLEECAMPERLVGFQTIDLFRVDGWERLLDALSVGSERLIQEQSPLRREEPDYRIIPVRIAEQDSAGEAYKVDLSYPRIVPDAEASIAEVNLRLAGWAIEQMQDLRADRLWSPEEREARKILPTRRFSPTELSCRYSVSLFTAELLSIAFTIWFYGSGAAHGNTTFKTFNLLLNPPTSVDLSRIFNRAAEYLPVLADMCRSDLLRQTGADPESIERGTAPEYRHFQAFHTDRSDCAVSLSAVPGRSFLLGPERSIVTLPVPDCIN